MEKQTQDRIRSQLGLLKIPKKKILLLRVRLKGLCDQFGADYRPLTELLVNAFQDAFHPETVLVPSFTYGYTKSRCFDVLNSPSEVGRFSEEVRNHFPNYRTPDPIFSLVDTGSLLKPLTGINYASAFGPGCIWEWLTERNFITVNIDLEDYLSTHLHYLEKLFSAPYRSDFSFPGEVILPDRSIQPIDYRFFARQLGDTSDWSRRKISQFLEKEGALSSGTFDKISVTWLDAQKTLSILAPILKKNPRYLVS